LQALWQCIQGYNFFVDMARLLLGHFNPLKSFFEHMVVNVPVSQKWSLKFLFLHNWQFFQIFLAKIYVYIASYKAYLERQKLEEAEAKDKKADDEAATSARRQGEKELEEEGKKLLSLEDSLKKAKTDQRAKQKLADSLLTEAEDKLKKAVQTGDVTDITIAQTLLETAQLKHAEERDS